MECVDAWGLKKTTNSNEAGGHAGVIGNRHDGGGGGPLVARKPDGRQQRRGAHGDRPGKPVENLADMHKRRPRHVAVGSVPKHGRVIGKMGEGGGVKGENGEWAQWLARRGAREETVW